MRFAASLVLFVASALAIQVTSPRDDDKWAASASGVLTWTSVSTDPAEMQVVLVNSDFSVNQVLMASVETAKGTVTIPPSSGGFPLGDDFRINLLSLKNGNTQPGILAQSGTFTIVAGTSTGTTSGVLPTTMTNSGVATVARGASVVVSTTATADDVLNPTESSSPNGAATSYSGAALTGALFGTVSALVALLL